jgi:predicted DNA-binding transcriptional regulator AlpA
MTAAKKDIADLPGWPRGLSLAQAAAYVGLSPNTFKFHVDAGKYPQPASVGRRKLWDRKALDLALDKVSGLSAESTGANDDQDEGKKRAEEFFNGQQGTKQPALRG